MTESPVVASSGAGASGSAPTLGCNADDSTGGADVASGLRRAGLRTVLLFGAPRSGRVLPDREAVIVAPKSRHLPPGEAVDRALSAQRWLARSKLHGRVPDVPPNTAGRSTKGTSSSATSCSRSRRCATTRWTLMRDSSLVRLLRGQTPHEVALVPHAIVREGATALARHAARRADRGRPSGRPRGLLLGADAASGRACCRSLPGATDRPDRRRTRAPGVPMARPATRRGSGADLLVGASRRASRGRRGADHRARDWRDRAARRAPWGAPTDRRRGETSGAVVEALGLDSVVVLAEEDPGDSWAVADGDPPLALLLQSGNFGRPDLFVRALEDLG